MQKALTVAFTMMLAANLAANAEPTQPLPAANAKETAKVETQITPTQSILGTNTQSQVKTSPITEAQATPIQPGFGAAPQPDPSVQPTADPATAPKTEALDKPTPEQGVKAEATEKTGEPSNVKKLFRMMHTENKAEAATDQPETQNQPQK
jgi:hypothetical protein